ncbi:tyrosine-type recombinase/integrase, partial [Pirellulales bacterium]|nr:tyrosine-type recombinase/integrase [Pirellulales bacterium]
MGNSKPTLEAPSFRFTEDRVEAALRLMQGENAPSRRLWRDDAGDGLHLRAGRNGGSYYWVARRSGKLEQHRLGDAERMKLTAARSAAKRMAGGDMAAKPRPIRVRTDGPRVAEVWGFYNEASHAGTFFTGRKPPKPSTLRSYAENWQPHIGKPYGSKSLAQLAKAVPKIHESLAKKPATQKRIMQIIHNVYLFARKKGWWTDADPTIDQDSGKAIKCGSVKARARVFRIEELERLMEAAAAQPFPWNVYFPMLFLTSVRMSTLRQMRWDEIDLRHRPALWQIQTTKNDDPLTLTLADTAVEMLKELK